MSKKPEVIFEGIRIEKKGGKVDLKIIFSDRVVKLKALPEMVNKLDISKARNMILFLGKKMLRYGNLILILFLEKM